MTNSKEPWYLRLHRAVTRKQASLDPMQLLKNEVLEDIALLERDILSRQLQQIDDQFKLQAQDAKRERTSAEPS